MSKLRDSEKGQWNGGSVISGRELDKQIGFDQLSKRIRETILELGREEIKLEAQLQKIESELTHFTHEYNRELMVSVLDHHPRIIIETRHGLINI